MNRRQVLVGGGVMLSTAVAGCTSSDETSGDTGGDGNGDTGGNDSEGTGGGDDGNTSPSNNEPDPASDTDEGEQPEPSGNDENWHGYDVEEVKSEAEQPDIDEFIRGMEEYNGESVYFEHVAINQRIELDGGFQFRLGLSETGQQIDGFAFGWWGSDRYLEGDVVEVWGVGEGPYSYETVQGDYRTVPAISLVDMELNE